MIRVLQEQIVYVKLLPYIFAFNLKDSEKQIEFMLANKDQKQWQVTKYTNQIGSSYLCAGTRGLNRSHLQPGNDGEDALQSNKS